MNGRLPIAVLVSGSGSNLQALIDAATDPAFHAEIVVVISDRAGVKALDRAAAAGVPAEVVDWDAHPGRAGFTEAVCATATAHGAAALVLAGFMRILAPVAIRRFPNRILNTHPALLPAFPGAHAVAQALAHGVTLTGVTIHLVDEEVDHGPIVYQEAIPVLPGDTEDTLRDRIQEVEHRRYPEVVDAFAAGRLRVEGRHVAWDPGVTPVKRALLSVSDKTGLVSFATRLVAAGVEIVSSGGTAAALAAAGLPVTPVAEVTGTPEMLDGRVKTLHPAIHAGILADVSRPEHVADLEAHGVEPFQLVVVDLYPFEATVADPEVAEPAAVEQIDIGGPTMIRAAAKNHASVAVVTSPGDYEAVAGMIESGGIDAATRRRLAATAFSRTAGYDAAILDWLHRGEPLPPSMVMALDRVDVLRYGENPHQEAAVYRHRGRTGWWDAAELIQGKALSFNNLADAEAAWRLATQLGGDGAAAVILKHTNPCGVAVRPGVAEAFAAAWECDPLSAFGGVVAVSGPLDGATASLLVDRFVEVVVAPVVATEAEAVLAAKPNMRVLVAPLPGDGDLDLRRLEDGFVAQRRDGNPDDDDWEVRSAVRPYEAQLADLRLAWKVAAAAKSNSVVIATGGAAVGIGAGDQSRVGAAVRAVAKAGERAHGAVAAGDGFFPFGDGVEVLAAAGVAAVVAPGGSRRDDEVVATADRLGIALILAKSRHFRH